MNIELNSNPMGVILTPRLNLSANNKIKAVQYTVPTTGWSNDDGAVNYYYYDVNVSGLTANDVVNVNVAIENIAAAKLCGLYQVTKSFAGKFRLFASSAPTSEINIEYYVLAGEA